MVVVFLTKKKCTTKTLLGNCNGYKSISLYKNVKDI